MPAQPAIISFSETLRNELGLNSLYVCRIAHSIDDMGPEWDCVENHFWKLRSTNLQVFNDLVSGLNPANETLSDEEKVYRLTEQALFWMCEADKEMLVQKGLIPVTNREPLFA